MLVIYTIIMIQASLDIRFTSFCTGRRYWTRGIPGIETSLYFRHYMNILLPVVTILTTCFDTEKLPILPT